MQKKLLILAVATLVLIGGAVLVWEKNAATQTIGESVPNQPVELDPITETSTEIIARNRDVSKWKTYRDDKNRIEFKYPEEMFELFDQTDPVGNTESMTTDVVTLFLFFRLPGNTSQTPIISFFFNQLSDREDQKGDKICKEVMVNAQKARLCGSQQDIENDLLVYNNYVQYGTCLEKGNYNGSLYINVNTRMVSEQLFTDGITIDLNCLHSESLGNIYKSIYQSVRFLESD